MKIPGSIKTIHLQKDKDEAGVPVPGAAEIDIRLIPGAVYLSNMPMFQRVQDALGGSRLSPISPQDVRDFLDLVIAGWRNYKGEDGNPVEFKTDKHGRLTDETRNGIGLLDISNIWQEFAESNWERWNGVPEKKA